MISFIALITSFGGKLMMGFNERSEKFPIFQFWGGDSKRQNSSTSRWSKYTQNQNDHQEEDNDPCHQRKCTSNEHCCDGHVCVDTQNSGDYMIIHYYDDYEYIYDNAMWRKLQCIMDIMDIMGTAVTDMFALTHRTDFFYQAFMMIIMILVVIIMMRIWQCYYSYNWHCCDGYGNAINHITMDIIGTAVTDIFGLAWLYDVYICQWQEFLAKAMFVINIVLVAVIVIVKTTLPRRQL